jgi:hypothetical protein
MNIYLIFYTNLLQRDPNNLLMPLVVIDKEEEEEIKEIIDS